MAQIQQVWNFSHYSRKPVEMSVVILKTSLETEAMDTAHQKLIQDEFGTFEDEVLNAGWLRPEPEMGSVAAPARGSVRPPLFDPEHFLEDVYRFQG